MELVLSIAFGVWFLIGAIFYGFITKVKENDEEKINVKKGGKK